MMTREEKAKIIRAEMAAVLRLARDGRNLGDKEVARRCSLVANLFLRDRPKKAKRNYKLGTEY